MRHGKYHSRQRYKCKDCFKTFNDMTNTPIGGTHKPHLWLYWKHKVLNAVRSLGDSVLQGVNESGETYLIESMKGSRNITTESLVCVAV